MKGYFMKVIVAAFAQLIVLSQWAHASSLEVCLKHYRGNEQDFSGLVGNGPIEVPAGTVFQSAGFRYGTPSDPRDEEHMQEGHDPAWSGIPQEEQIRRAKILQQERSGQPPKTAFVLTRSLILSKRHYCAMGSVNNILSSTWGWEKAGAGASDVYYEAYGIYKENMLNTSFDKMRGVGFAAQSGQLVATIHGKVTTTVYEP
ncbi:hypothetical protein [Acetobacter orientalis]